MVLLWDHVKNILQGSIWHHSQGKYQLKKQKNGLLVILQHSTSRNYQQLNNFLDGADV